MAFTEFFARRWRGEVALRTLFWRDMLVVGSAINAVASVMALILVAQGAAPAHAVAVHFAPLPYNVFLFMALGRSRQCTATMSFLGGVWLVVATLV